MPPLLILQDIRLGFGGAPLIDGATISVAKGDRTCLVGRNGAGKSTLMKIAAGLVEPDSGTRFVQPGTHVAYLPQEPDLSSYATISDYVADGLESDREDARYRAEAALQDVRLDPGSDPKSLSGGETRRAALARTLVGEPDILFLDEPTNHLDLPAIEWLEKTLDSFRGAFVLISHDRTFLRKLTKSCMWVDRGRVRSMDQGFEHFDAWSTQLLEQEAAERDRLQKRIEREQVWLHKGVTARRKRNMGRLRRLDQMRSERLQWIGPQGTVNLALDSGTSSGTMVIEAKNIAKSYEASDSKRTIITDFSTRVHRGDRVGIIGPNGAGKTTLLQLLTGTLEPDAGTVRLGTNLTPLFLEQKRDSLDDAETLWKHLAPKGGDQITVRGRPKHVVSYLKDFLFDESQARQPVGTLSGGERNRLMLAIGMAQPSNLLILDEPTNDLDMDTLDLLEEVLSDYDGTILLVSHDRDFLDRLVTSTIVMEGDGTAIEYAGGYSDYLAQRAEPSTVSEGAKKQRKSEAPRTARKKSKLSYKEQMALNRLAEQIPTLEDEISRLEQTLAEPDIFTRDPDGFHKKADRLETARAELAACEEQWLEIELLREELGLTP